MRGIVHRLDRRLAAVERRVEQRRQADMPARLHRCQPVDEAGIGPRGVGRRADAVQFRREVRCGRSCPGRRCRSGRRIRPSAASGPARSSRSRGRGRWCPCTGCEPDRPRTGSGSGSVDPDPFVQPVLDDHWRPGRIDASRSARPGVETQTASATASIRRTAFANGCSVPASGWVSGMSSRSSSRSNSSFAPVRRAWAARRFAVGSSGMAWRWVTMMSAVAVEHRFGIRQDDVERAADRRMIQRLQQADVAARALGRRCRSVPARWRSGVLRRCRRMAFRFRSAQVVVRVEIRDHHRARDAAAGPPVAQGGPHRLENRQPVASRRRV